MGNHQSSTEFLQTVRDSENSENEFEFREVPFRRKSIWYKPFNNGWYWSPDGPRWAGKRRWMPVWCPYVIGKGRWEGQFPGQDNQEVMEALRLTGLCVGDRSVAHPGKDRLFFTAESMFCPKRIKTADAVVADLNKITKVYVSDLMTGKSDTPLLEFASEAEKVLGGLQNNSETVVASPITSTEVATLVPEAEVREARAEIAKLSQADIPKVAKGVADTVMMAYTTGLTEAIKGKGHDPALFLENLSAEYKGIGVSLCKIEGIVIKKAKKPDFIGFDYYTLTLRYNAEYDSNDPEALETFARKVAQKLSMHCPTGMEHLLKLGLLGVSTRRGSVAVDFHFVDVSGSAAAFVKQFLVLANVDRPEWLEAIILGYCAYSLTTYLLTVTLAGVITVSTAAVWPIAVTVGLTAAGIAFLIRESKKL